MIDRVQFSTGPAVGANGSATATAYSPHVSGQVLAAKVEYVDTPPAGTTLFDLYDENLPDESIVDLGPAATDLVIYPRRLAQDSADNDLTGWYTPYVVHGRLVATIAEANANDSVTVTVWVQR